MPAGHASVAVPEVNDWPMTVEQADIQLIAASDFCIMDVVKFVCYQQDRLESLLVNICYAESVRLSPLLYMLQWHAS